MCAEALLPLAITAVFTTGGPHNSEHAKWGKSGEVHMSDRAGGVMVGAKGGQPSETKTRGGWEEVGAGVVQTASPMYPVTSCEGSEMKNA